MIIIIVFSSNISTTNIINKTGILKVYVIGGNRFDCDESHYLLKE